MRHRDWTLMGGVVLTCATVLMGCAESRPSAELMRARTAYQAAKMGPAAQNDPDRLAAAKQALDRAEAAHEDDPGKLEERHYAYIAERSAEMANVYGQIACNQRDLQLAAYEYAQAQDTLRKQQEFELTSAQKVDEAALERECLQKIQATLSAELQSLKEQASIREDQRGLIITLNGSVLFASDSSNLLPTAKDRLFQVAMALQTLRPGQSVVVEGHTDSTGGDEYNKQLSLRRAESVRDFLISQGVPPDRIRAMGHGEEKPITDNKSPEGRANNRRVEIIIPTTPGQFQQDQQQPQQQQPMQEQKKNPTKDEPTSRR